MEPGDIANNRSAAKDYARPPIKEVFYNLQNRFASLVFTIPNLDVGIPEDPTLTPKTDGIVVVEKNSGKYARVRFSPDEIEVTDWSIKPHIDEVRWKGKTYTGEQLLAQKDQLLQEFFTDILGGEENVGKLRIACEAAGLVKGSYLYRAISKPEYRQLSREGSKYVNYLDPSANFESEEMFNGEYSQVKQYASQGGEDYSGQIIRWKIQDPILYRRAGFNPPRVVPMFIHFLPAEIELSNDGGKTFKMYKDFTGV